MEKYSVKSIFPQLQWSHEKDNILRQDPIMCLLDRVNGHAAAPPVLKTGPHAPTVADTDEIFFRPSLVMPCKDATATSQFQESAPNHIRLELQIVS